MTTACGSSGWRLVFNDEPDAWGTQHDPVFDVAEVRLDYSQARAADDSFRAMSASVVMTTAEQGRFVLVWGPHEWTADFTVARQPSVEVVGEGTPNGNDYGKDLLRQHYEAHPH